MGEDPDPGPELRSGAPWLFLLLLEEKFSGMEASGAGGWASPVPAPTPHPARQLPALPRRTRPQARCAFSLGDMDRPHRAAGLPVTDEAPAGRAVGSHPQGTPQGIAQRLARRPPRARRGDRPESPACPGAQVPRWGPRWGPRWFLRGVPSPCFRPGQRGSVIPCGPGRQFDSQPGRAFWGAGSTPSPGRVGGGQPTILSRWVFLSRPLPSALNSI